MGLFGQAIRRVEDPKILTGRATYTDDVDIPDCLFVAIVRSPFASARILNIDTSAATRHPHVVEVFTAERLGRLNGPMPHPTWEEPPARLRQLIELEARPETLSLLAAGRVRYVGEPIAAVVAMDPYAAADAVMLVSVEYEALPAVLSVAEARPSQGEAKVNDDWEDNIAARFSITKGETKRAFETAKVVIEGTFTFGRQTGTPIEARAVQADGTSETLTVWSSTQAPYWLRDALVSLLSVEKDVVRVIAPAVGGGFGTKSMVYPEDLLIPVLAKLLRRAVRWSEVRTENFLAAVHARDQRHDIRLALDSDGTIIALEDRYSVDVGAANLESLVVPYNTAGHLQGCYRVPNLRIECTCVVTNKAPLSAYRGTGRPEAVFAMERVLDQGARKLGIDPAELRRRNLLRPTDMPYAAGIPYRNGDDLIIDGGGHLAAFERALVELDYEGIRREQAVQRDGRLLGIGLCTYLEGTGIGPQEHALARLTANGQVTVTVGVPSQGQSHETTLAQIAADELGLPMEAISIRQGDTALLASGGATIASRTAVVVGNAVAIAAANLRQGILEHGARLLEADPSDVVLESDGVHLRGHATRLVSLGELARAANADGAVEGIEGAGSFEPQRITYAHGTHAAVVEVDPVTGRVEVLRYLVVHDCGRVINPTVVDGQVVGGVVQGIGGALMEELLYDETGQLMTASFLDYPIPRATDVPNIEVFHMETPSERNPLGIRGVGEGGTVGPAAVLAGAVEDALRRYQVVVDHCPMTPAYVSGLVYRAGAVLVPMDSPIGRLRE